jgi:hypothetical protein
MESKCADSSTVPTIASMGMLMPLLGFLVVLTIQPPILLESGSGMGNYKMPSGGWGGQGATPSAGTPGPSDAASAGNLVTPTSVVVDITIPANDTANNSL